MIRFDGVTEPIVRPSDFKLSVRLRTGVNYVDFSVTQMSYLFLFKDSYGNDYECEFTPDKQINCVVDADDSTKLHLLMETKNLKKGKLSLKIGTKIADQDFADGFWHVFKKREETNIELI